MDDFRRFFLRGLGVLVPTLLTIAIVVWGYRLINDNVGAYVTDGLLRLCSWVSPEPPAGWIDPESDALRYGTRIDEWDEWGRRSTVEHTVIRNYANLLENNRLEDIPEGVTARAEAAKNDALWRITFARYRLHLVGFAIAIVLVYFVGFFLASFIGRTSWRATEGLLLRIPLIKAVYANVKQVTDFLLTERSVEFSDVVAVQYPRKGVWSLGLSTGAPIKQLQTNVSDELVTVFIPSSPTPITGYVIQVPRRDVIELNMSIDEGLRFTISAGVIKPGSTLPGAALERAKE